MEYAWTSRDGRVEGPTVLPSKAMFPVAVAAFGGAVVWGDAYAGLQMMRIGGKVETLAPVVGMGISATGNGDRLWIVKPGKAPFLSPSAIDLLTVKPDGTHTSEPLGQGSGLGETGATYTDCGILIVWAGPRSEAYLAVATLDGELVGRPIIVSAPNERLRHPSVTWLDGTAYVVWSQMGTKRLRLARVAVN